MKVKTAEALNEMREQTEDAMAAEQTEPHSVPAAQDPQQSGPLYSGFDFPEMLTAGYLPVNCFVFDPVLKGRAGDRTDAELAEIAASIKLIGQSAAVEFLLRKVDEDQKKTLIYPSDYQHLPGLPDGTEVVLNKGHGRLAAIRRLLAAGESWPNGPGVKAVLSDLPGENWDAIRLDAITAGIHDNVHRHSLKPKDVVWLIRMLQNPPWNMELGEIAERIGVRPSVISQHLTYARMEAGIQQAVDEGRLPFREVRNWGKLTPAQQKQALRKWEARRIAKKENKPVRGREAAKVRRAAKKAPPKPAAPKPPYLSPLDAYARAGGFTPLRKLLRKAQAYITASGTARQQAMRDLQQVAKNLITEGDKLAKASATPPPAPLLPGKTEAKKQRNTERLAHRLHPKPPAAASRRRTP